MQPLTGAQRRYLRSLAQALKPVAWVGKEGASGELTSRIAKETGAEVIGMIGSIAILYRILLP